MSELAFLGFEELLALAKDDPEAEAEIRRRWVTSAAVLIVDFTSMVRRTDEIGIVQALAMARAGERALLPVVASCEGSILKRVADTLFIVFSTAPQALAAAFGAQQRIQSFSADFRACMGLGCGEVLLIPGVDVYGPEVNRAFVLGEDVAKGGEVLATDTFLAALGPLPEGIGAHRGPTDREQEAGFPFHVLRDFR